MWPCIHWSWLVTLHSDHHVSPTLPTTHLAYTPGASGWAHPAPQDTTPMRELWVWAGARVTRGPPLSPCRREGGIPSHNSLADCHLTRVLAGGGGTEHAGGDLPAVVHRPRARGVAHGPHPGLNMGTCGYILT